MPKPILLGVYHIKDIQEWEMYQNVLLEAKKKGIPWLDIRGNHDAFDVPSVNGEWEHVHGVNESGVVSNDKILNLFALPLSLAYL